MTHFLINRALEEIASQIEKRVAAERERDEARAEVERLRAALDEVGRGGPVWMNDRDGATVIRSMHAKIKEGVAEIQRLRGELDRLKSTMHFMGEPFDAWFKALDLCWKRTDLMGTESITKLAAKYDALRAAPPVVHTTNIEAAAKEIADGFELHLGDDDTRTTEIVRDILREHTRPIDQTSPAVCAVDVKATARAVSRIIEGGDEGNFEGTVEAALYEHTRAVSVEEVARAIHEEEAMRGDTWERIVKGNPVALALRFSAARAALRAIGARLAEPVGRDPVGAERASLAAIKADAGKRLDAAKESMRAGGYLAAQPVEPKPPEPAKARVKLPTASIFHASDGEALLRRSVVVVLLREQGVEVDDDS